MFDFLDESIRIGFPHFRLLCPSPEARSRHYRKASPTQVEQIDGVIKLLKLADGEFLEASVVFRGFKAWAFGVLKPRKRV